MSNKRLTFYFNTDLPDQATLYSFLKNEGNMNQTVRDGLSLIVELRKINNALPELLKTTLQNSGSIADISAIFDVMASLSKHSEKSVQSREATEKTEPTVKKVISPSTLAKKEAINNAKNFFGKNK